MKTNPLKPVSTPHRFGSACWTLARRLLVAAAFILPTALPSSSAAVIEAWVARYNNVLSNANGMSSKIVRDEAGNVIVTGYASDGVVGQDMLTIKYSGANGSVLWQQRYNGPANGNDVAQALAVDSSGNVVVAGYSFAGLDTNGFLFLIYDYYIAKYAAADGTLLWERRYYNPNEGSEVTALFVDVNDDAVVVGSGHTANYAAADGALRWRQSHSGIVKAAVLDTSGNVVLTGERSTLKYAAADGSLLWEHPHASDASIRASALDGSGNLVVTGSRSNEWYTAKYAAVTGALLWEKRAGFPTAYGINGALALALDRNGNVVVTGYSTTGFQGWGWPVFTEYYTARYAAGTGALVWSKIYPGWQTATFDGNNNVIVENLNHYAKFAAVNGALLAEGEFPFPSGAAKVSDGSGNVVVTGGNFETAKYVAATGAELWRQQFKGPSNLSDSAQAVAVDGNGNVVVTGNSVGFTDDLGSLDYYTAKYAASNGALLWEKRHNGPANLDDGPVAVAVDSAGNVVVTGWETGTTYGRGCYTAKYAAADGDLLWEKRSPVTAVAVAVDANGNAVLTGTYPVDGGVNDFYAAKYAAADGTLLWEKRYHDRADSAYNATAGVVDRNGNVVVTGPGRTVKYAAANGSLLWDRPTPFNVLAMALDGSGNVIVTGSSTAKYAAADGALFWEQPISAFAIAVDGSGNVALMGSDRTAKYAAADGALLWVANRPVPVEYAAVAVDGSGNVVLTGTSGITSNAFDYYTAKYASATGALLWERSYNGPANGYDFTRAAHPLALGPNGMIAVTGYSSAFADPLIIFGGTSAYDFATVVYREDVPPSVSIERVPGGANAMILSWLANAVGFTLQSTLDLTPPVTWNDLTHPPAVIGGQFTVTNTASGSAQFFRLRSSN